MNRFPIVFNFGLPYEPVCDMNAWEMFGILPSRRAHDSIRAYLLDTHTYTSSVLISKDIYMDSNKGLKSMGFQLWDFSCNKRGFLYRDSLSCYKDLKGYNRIDTTKPIKEYKGIHLQIVSLINDIKDFFE